MALDLIAELEGVVDALDPADLAALESLATTSKADAIDMSSAALAGRLEQVCALYKLMVYLGRARIIDPVETR